jgi:hypothetical protein
MLFEALNTEQLRNDRLGVEHAAGVAHRPEHRPTHADRPATERLDRSHLKPIIRAT